MTVSDTTFAEWVLCPVCGGRVNLWNREKVNTCTYCGSPVLGPSQNRECVNHPGRLATEVCRVCKDLICDECAERRVGDYGGKLLTIVNCQKSGCVHESEWAKPLNEEYQKLANMDWADKSDNFILRITGLGAIIMMVFELVFILGLFYVFNLGGWGFSNVPYLASLGYTGWVFQFAGNMAVLLLSVFGNLLGAVLLMTALQVYVHERQLSSGILLLVVLIFEVAHLLFRGFFFNLRYTPYALFVQVLLASFLLGTILVFAGSLMAIYNGNKKRVQLKRAREKLGLSLK
jgi:hypothetical protein